MSVRARAALLRIYEPKVGMIAGFTVRLDKIQFFTFVLNIRESFAAADDFFRLDEH